MSVLIQTEKSLHERMKERIADEYRQKGYSVLTEKQIGRRRVDIYAENDKEVLIIEIVDTHYSGVLDGKLLAQLKVKLKVERTRKRTTASLDEKFLEWIQQKIKEKRFASVTHAIEYALDKLRKEEP
jgi:hypothetical protein